ncbi:MAG: hypothetical protein QY322_04250 [bacterium]|nr:MAG: hypothetical protein QY322_04250 [bacterium]
MSKENKPDLELLELKSHSKPKEEPKPDPEPVNKGTNSLETN